MGFRWTPLGWALILSACGQQRLAVPQDVDADSTARTPNSVPPQPTPPIPPAPPLKITADTKLSLGRAHACILTETATLCWGSNLFGAAGNLSPWNQLVPARIAQVPTKFTSLSAATFHTCAASADGRAFCWGDARWSQFATGDLSPLFKATTPTEISGLKGVLKVVAGERFSCALVADGVHCWGSSSPAIVTPTGLEKDVGLIAAGVRHACAALNSGGALCWGENKQGQTGVVGAQVPVELPSPVQGLTGRLQALALGDTFSCAATEGEGAVLCWGTLGIAGGTADVPQPPTRVPGLKNIVQLAAGSAHVCALEKTGEVWCWGTNSDGRLGHSLADGTPRKVADLQSKAVAIGAGGTAGEGRSCALLDDSRLFCWGANRDEFRTGLLGLGAEIGNISVPTLVKLP